MTKLAQIQQKFQAKLLGSPSKLEDLVHITEGLTSQQRIDIYSKGYLLRLTHALYNNYPQLHKYLGTKQFNELAIEYIKCYPSTFYSTCWYGDHLAQFLKEQEPYIEYPILSELAKFEWSIDNTFNAKDARVLTYYDLLNFAINQWPELIFTFHPSMQLESFNYNTFTVFHALLNDRKPRVRLLRHKQHILFWRKQLQPLHQPLRHLEYLGLTTALKHNNFATICETICQLAPVKKASIIAAEIINKWLINELITSLTIDN